MTTFIRTAYGRGTRWVHGPVFLLLLLITASYVAPRSVMRSDAYGIALLFLIGVDVALCSLLRFANIALDTIRESRR